VEDGDPTPERKKVDENVEKGGMVRRVGGVPEDAEKGLTPAQT